MPAALSYSPEDKALREEAAAELKARRQESAAAWAYYLGQHKPSLKVRRGGHNDNVVINVARMIVDRTASFRVPSFPDLQLDELRDTEAEKELRLMWLANGGPSLLSEMVKTGCLDGHVFARVLERGAGAKYPRVISLDPANVLIWWQADDYKTTLWYEVNYVAGGYEWRQDVVDEGGQWGIYEYKRKHDPSGMNNGSWERGRVSKWEYEVSPIVDVAHIVLPKRRYGAGELGHAQLNDAINRQRSDMSRILRFHASPRTVGTGFKADDVTETEVAGLWTIESEQAKVFNLEMRGDLTASREMSRDLEEAFFAEARVVLPRGNVEAFKNVTNLGLRVLYQDMLAKNAELGWGYAGLIEGVSQRLRMVMGAQDFDSPVKVIWPDSLPQEPGELVDVVERKRAMEIVSKQTAAEELGENYTLEVERIAEEERLAPPAVSGEVVGGSEDVAQQAF